MPKYRLSDNSVIDLEGYSQEAIDFFLEENEDAVLVKDNEPVKTEAVATETAPVTAVNETAVNKAVDTDLASEDISLEQFEAMEGRCPQKKGNIGYQILHNTSPPIPKARALLNLLNLPP